MALSAKGIVAIRNLLYSRTRGDIKGLLLEAGAKPERLLPIEIINDMKSPRYLSKETIINLMFDTIYSDYEKDEADKIVLNLLEILESKGVDISDSIETLTADGIKFNHRPSDKPIVSKPANKREEIAVDMPYEFDAFICHASEDKEEFVRPLAEELRRREVHVWYDEFTLEVGDSLRRSIDRGLAKSKYGIVILSPYFFKKEWAQKELDGLAAREVRGTKVILPVWHNVNREDIENYSPMLADRVGVSTSKGLKHVVDMLIIVIKSSSNVGSRGGNKSPDIANVSTSIGPEIKREISDAEVWKRITESISGCNLTGKRMFILTGYSKNRMSLPTWLDPNSELVRSFENPPDLRKKGWGLDTGLDRSKIVKGEFRRVVQERIKILDFYRDGTLVFAASAQGDFLARDREITSYLKLNPLGLVEVVYNFVNLFKLIIENYEPRPLEVFIRVDLHNMHLNGEKTYMAPYSLGTFEHGQFYAPSDAWNKTLPFGSSSFDIATASYRIVQEIYLWFGMEPDTIPYALLKTGHKMINSEAIRNIK
jgi:hypothetical protein